MAILLAATSAVAGERGWYLSVEGAIRDSSDEKAQMLVGMAAPFVIDPLSELHTFSPGGSMGPVSYSFNTYAADEGVAAFASVGIHLTDDIRLEAEFGHRAADFGKMNVKQNALLLNAAFDLTIIDDLTLSIGAGAGADRIAFDAINTDDEEIAFAYQVKGGLAYAIGDKTEVLVTYRYFDAPDAQVGAIKGAIADATVEGFRDNAISIGLRFDL